MRRRACDVRGPMDGRGADAVPAASIRSSTEAGAPNPAEKRTASPRSWGSRVGFHQVARYPRPLGNSRVNTRPRPPYWASEETASALAPVTSSTSLTRSGSHPRSCANAGALRSKARHSTPRTSGVTTQRQPRSDNLRGKACVSPWAERDSQRNGSLAACPVSCCG